ncbi:putative purine permease 11 [Tasmannia lanceolata]|uniref:putative purine permease 11 n=1 Tax=Tasmannia lanceolata TaxID=3420 RepID=UPI00406356FE
MGELQEFHLQIKEVQAPNSSKDATPINQQLQPNLRHSQWWILVALNIAFLISGQSAGTLLGRFYYDKGGNSIWMATLVQTAGFPILLLPLFLFRSPTTSTTITTTPSVTTLAFLYVSLGLLMAGDNVMYSYGLLYLPVSTYSLLCATQLAFNAFFSYYFNSQKFTPLILNSVVLLSLSASLLAIQSDSADPTGASTGKHVAGFLFTLGASATYSLWLSLTQLSFQKVLKKETFYVIFVMQFYTSAVASCACVVGLFASREWRSLKGEMEGFEKGKVSYIMTLVWTAVSWQVCTVSSVVLVFMISSLFTNVISTLALPVVPIFAVIFFHEKMDGVKVVAMLLAIWGFLSYFFQHYLDGYKPNTTRTDVNEVSGASS